MTGLPAAAPAFADARRWRLPGKILAALGVGGLAAISWIYPATTRMYAFPWEIILDFTLLVPPLLLLLQSAGSQQPRSLPVPWGGLGIAAALIVFFSALCSPYRETAFRNSAIAWSGIAWFFVVLFWIRPVGADRGRRVLGLQKLLGGFLAVIAVISLARWLGTLRGNTFAAVANGRNAFPLGHSNYTAGISLLMIPTFASLARGSRGVSRAGWAAMAALAIGLLFTTSSRGGWLGFGVLVLVLIPQYWRFSRRTLLLSAAVAVAVLLAGLWLNPRTRGTFSGQALRSSDTQRLAMVQGGWLMGRERPLLGWGLGTTPLVFPRYRGELAGGAEDVLELHSTPVQLWAELGLGGILLLAGAIFVLAATWQRENARLHLYPFFGYALFSLTDWQLDVPIFVAVLGGGAAVIAANSSGSARSGSWPRGFVVALASGLLLLIVFSALSKNQDPTPAWNVRALALGQEPGKAPAAVALLERSLKLNPDQEIAHFNLGWLEVVENPAAAAAHFQAAAQLVPDKGGVYFGLGLADLNRGQDEAAARALALEALNDPAFLVSPWRQSPRIQNLDTKFRRAFAEAVAQALAWSGRAPESQATLGYLQELEAWISTGAIVTGADTPARRQFFASHPTPEPLTKAGVLAYHRERTGYPVLMRDLNLPPPTDIFLVQENALAAHEWKFLFPEKGWLDNGILLRLLSSQWGR